MNTTHIELAARIEKLRERLHEQIVDSAEVELEIANFIPKERRLRARSRVVNGKRILPSKKEEKKFDKMRRRINSLERTISAIRKEHPDFRKLDRAEQEWIRLQGKDTEYKVDVELDQLMTFFRVSLVNLYTYLARMMGWSHLSLVRLLHSVLFWWQDRRNAYEQAHHPEAKRKGSKDDGGIVYSDREDQCTRDSKSCGSDTHLCA